MVVEGIGSVVEAFFASYRAAFESSDVEAVAEHFGNTVPVASDTGSGLRVELVTRAKWRAIIGNCFRYTARSTLAGQSSGRF